MSTVDIDAARSALQAERRRLVSAVAYLGRPEEGTEEEPENDNGGEGNHPADSATTLEDRELDEGLKEGDEAQIEQIDRALARIEAGTYGTCERCGREIGAERLAALPWATLCIDDQQLADRS